MFWKGWKAAIDDLAGSVDRQVKVLHNRIRAVADQLDGAQSRLAVFVAKVDRDEQRYHDLAARLRRLDGRLRAMECRARCKPGPVFWKFVCFDERSDGVMGKVAVIRLTLPPAAPSDDPNQVVVRRKLRIDTPMGTLSVAELAAEMTEYLFRLPPATPWSGELRDRDEAGNWSDPSAFEGESPALDTTPPDRPGAVTSQFEGWEEEQEVELSEASGLLGVGESELPAIGDPPPAQETAPGTETQVDQA